MDVNSIIAFLFTKLESALFSGIGKVGISNPLWKALKISGSLKDLTALGWKEHYLEAK